MPPCPEDMIEIYDFINLINYDLMIKTSCWAQSKSKMDLQNVVCSRSKETKWPRREFKTQAHFSTKNFKKIKINKK